MEASEAVAYAASAFSLPDYNQQQNGTVLNPGLNEVDNPATAYHNHHGVVGYGNAGNESGYGSASINYNDASALDQLTLRLDDADELNALTLTNLLNSGVEEALSNLTPAQLIQLEKNVQKLKKQKTPSTGSSAAMRQKRASADPNANPVEKKRRSDSGSHRSTGGQYMNLPASAPHVEIRNGVEWLFFTYSTKGHIQEYCIRIDIDNLSLDEIPAEFKEENCVYPRALSGKDSYTGNRFDYETNVNELAWKLTWMNPETLSGKRGLIQRAVDSYRNRTPASRSRRVLRQQKLSEGVLRRRSSNASIDHASALAGLESIHYGSSMPTRSMIFQYTTKTGEMVRAKLRVDIENVDSTQLDEAFKAANCIYPQALSEQYGGGIGSRYEYETACNEIAWRLACLNANKLANQPYILQKAVDAYRERFETASNVMDHQNIANAAGYMVHHQAGTTGNDFSDIVAHTLQQVLAQGGAGVDDHHSHISLEDHLSGLDSHNGSGVSHYVDENAGHHGDLMGGI